MIFYNDEQCEDLINVHSAVDVVRSVFENIKDTNMISKTYLDIEDVEENFLGDFRAMPAQIQDVAGIKWVSVFPKNKAWPTVIGTILLNSAENGKLLAVLDATYITKVRTAAAAAVATEKLANKDSEVASFVGCGGQTMLHVEAIDYVMPNLSRFVFYDKNKEAAEAIANRISHHEVVVANTIEECVSQADVLTTLTPSRSPIVKGGLLKRGVHINAMGADAEGKREFDHATYKMVDIWTVDDFDQAVHSGETQHAYKKRNGLMACMPWPKKGEGREISSLSEIVGRVKKDQITLFDSTGLAIQDIAVADYIYKKDN
jgi:alanine dehydrogenase